MKIYGLLGYPLGHSFSKQYFTKKFADNQVSDCQYLNFSFSDIRHAVLELKSLSDLKGFNVTIPHKEKIIPFLDELSDTVRAIQSCNCIKIIDGRWIGNNTDVIGFEKSLKPLLKSHHNRALVFGTGGASKAVLFVLSKLGIGFKCVSRSKKENTYTYDELSNEIISYYPILINTTPVGQSPNSDSLLPLPYEAVTKSHLAFDLIYNPKETAFLREAYRKGAITKNGMEMLDIQAEESWKIWSSN